MPTFEESLAYVRSGGRIRRPNSTKIIEIKYALQARDMVSNKIVDWDSAEDDIMANDWIPVTDTGQPSG